MKTKKAIELLEPIPAENFITREFTDGEKKCCVIGHLSRLTSEDPTNYSYENCSDFLSQNEEVLYLRKASKRFITSIHNRADDIAEVNNQDTINGYTEPEIKDRVMHLLKDMDAAGY